VLKFHSNQCVPWQLIYDPDIPQVSQQMFGFVPVLSSFLHLTGKAIPAIISPHWPAIIDYGVLTSQSYWDSWREAASCAEPPFVPFLTEKITAVRRLTFIALNVCNLIAAS
jgi:hypothetical protein